MSVRNSTLSTAGLAAVLCLAGPAFTLAQIADPIPPRTDHIQITKQVVNPSGTPITGIPFVMNVGCAPGGTNTSITLFAPNNLTGVVAVPASRTCSVVEAPPKAPEGCTWSTTYPYGNKVSHGGKVVVVNTLTCREGKPVTVRKVVVNHTPIATPTGGFQMHLGCTGGQNFNFTLNPPLSASRSVAIASGATCTVTELPPPPLPKPCRWQTSYSPQTGGAGALLTVTNEMICRQPT